MDIPIFLEVMTRGGVMYGSKENDLTQILIDALNAEYKAE